MRPCRPCSARMRAHARLLCAPPATVKFIWACCPSCPCPRTAHSHASARHAPGAAARWPAAAARPGPPIPPTTPSPLQGALQGAHVSAACGVLWRPAGGWQQQQCQANGMQARTAAASCTCSAACQQARRPRPAVLVHFGGQQAVALAPGSNSVPPQLSRSLRPSHARATPPPVKQAERCVGAPPCTHMSHSLTWRVVVRVLHAVHTACHLYKAPTACTACLRCHVAAHAMPTSRPIAPFPPPPRPLQHAVPLPLRQVLGVHL